MMQPRSKGMPVNAHPGIMGSEGFPGAFPYGAAGPSPNPGLFDEILGTLLLAFLSPQVRGTSTVVVGRLNGQGSNPSYLGHGQHSHLRYYRP